MITAKEAAMRSKYQDKFIREMNLIEEKIDGAIKAGKYGVSYSPFTPYGDELLILIKNELESLGYKFRYDPPEPLPSGCPVDQWSFNAFVHISWEVK